MAKKDDKTKLELPEMPKFATLAELKAWAEKLSPEVRNALTHRIYDATEKLIGG